MKNIDTSVFVGKLEFKNPLIAASGTFGYGLEFEKILDLNAIGGFCTKGLSLSPREGNPPPRIHETHGGMLNSIGLHNIGVKAFIADKLPKLKKYNTHIIANVYGETFEEFEEVVRILSDEAGISALEINVSCPNVKKGGLDLGTNPQKVFELLKRLRLVTSKPLWAKLTPNVTDILELSKSAIDAGADALVLINSVRALSLNWKTNEPHLYTNFGGLTGPAIKPIALGKVFEVAKHFSIPIVGVGGICNAHDVMDFIVAGASAVEIGTQNFIKTTSMTDIACDLEKLLQENSIDRLSAYKGKIHHKTIL